MGRWIDLISTDTQGIAPNKPKEPSSVSTDTQGMVPNKPKKPTPTASEQTYYGFSLGDLKAEAYPDEWEEVKGNPEILRVFALSLLESRQMAACVPPERFTKLARCKGCGAVMVPATWPTERVKHDLGMNACETWEECPTCPWCKQRHQGSDHHKPCPTNKPRPITWQGPAER